MILDIIINSTSNLNLDLTILPKHNQLLEKFGSQHSNNKKEMIIWRIVRGSVQFQTSVFCLERLPPVANFVEASLIVEKSVKG